MDTGNSRPLVGRLTEQALLAGFLTDAGERPVLVDVASEPGVGKSRLLAEWAVAARTAGATVHMRAERSPVAALRAATAPGSRQVVLLDDLHQADADVTSAVLDTLRHPPPAGIVLVLAYRPRQTSPSLLAAVGSAAPAWAARHVPLAPFTRTETATFAADRFCGRHRATCFEDTDGVARYLEVLMADCQTDSCRSGPGNDSTIAARAAAPLLAELHRQPDDARLVADAAAVLGEEFRPHLLPEITELTLPSVLAAMDALLADDLLRPAPEAGSFTFRHPVLRRACYAATPPGWRLAAHQRAAAALRRCGTPVTGYAGHVLRAVGTGVAADVSVLADAADAAANDDPATAAVWYRAALDLPVPDDVAAPHRPALLTGLSATAGATGRFTECRTALQRYDDLADDSGPAGRLVTTALWRAELARSDGDRGAARQILHTALRLLPDQTESTRLLVALAAEAVSGGVLAPREPASDDLDSSCDDALLATAGGADELLRAYAIAVKATVCLAAGGLSAARRGSRAAAEIVDGRSDAQLTGAAPVLIALAWLEAHLDQHAAATRHFGRALAIGRATGRWPVVLDATLGLGGVRLRRGDIPAAVHLATEAVRLTELVPAAEPGAAAWCLRSATSLVAGDPVAALDQARAAVTAIGDATLSPWYAQARESLAAAQLAHDDLAGCRRTLAGSDRTAAARPSWERTAYAALTASVALAAGDGDAARDICQQAQSAAAALGLPAQIASAALHAARVAARPAEKLSLASAAVTTAIVADCPLETGWARLTAAEALIALDEPHRAAEHLDEAEEIALRAQAGALCAAVAAARAAAGSAAQQTMLSRREFEIAKLVSQGCTNRQIARTLDVSHKTIETHLGRIFVKLDVSSRAEIANLVGRAVVSARPARARSPRAPEPAGARPTAGT
ncbi:LuxR C-terminal-related transcriptional regulator [Actinoplanes sp. NPDC051859]|uniref:helix-turn-helix transcriptional regulator n=1 Tax=Actinoplanes sp. NPDC051859 TaxID=3363909 RepID=UPI0037A072FE